MAKLSPNLQLEQRIVTLRGCKVVLDSDLAAIYGVTTKRLNEQLRRNRKKFPPDFAFQLTNREWDALRSQFATLNIGVSASTAGTSVERVDLRSQFVTSSSDHGGRRHLPYVFTEHGALQAANVLNSPRAVAMSIYVIRAFIKLREQIAANQAILKRLGRDRTGAADSRRRLTGHL
jgi:hypothetical protein